MWKNPAGTGTVPSGFYTQSTARTTASSALAVSPSQSASAASAPQQQRSSYYSYGQRNGYNPYGQAPTATISSVGYASLSTSPKEASATTPPASARKRPRQHTYLCEPCNLELDSLKALESHKKSHVKCNVCGFEGAPKVVKGHFQAVHGKFSGSGFKTVTVQIPGCPVQRFRICVGNRPEDVQKWIQERKKKFPRSRPPPVEVKSVEQKGLSTLLQGYSSSEDEKEAEDKNLPAESPVESTKPPPDSAPPMPNAQKPCHSFVRHGRCRRGDACPYSHDPSLRKPRNGSNPPKRKNDLLSKLLEGDADRESKLTLQLIHYMVHSDFLEKRVS